MRQSPYIAVFALSLLLVLLHGPASLQAQGIITILYDNRAVVEEATADWGFACLIETPTARILFDTGANGDILVDNCRTLGVGLDQIDLVVLSHSHGDHTGGLTPVLARNKGARVFVPASFPDILLEHITTAGGVPVRVEDPREIADHVYLTGEMGDQIHEQSLILDTTDGLVVVTGCSHQGIVEILHRTKTILKKDILFVFGGFHLLRHPDDQVDEIVREFRSLGVKRCGSTHCTGDDAIALFKKEYGSDFVTVGVGRVLAASF